MLEFTGERVVPGQVEPDLWNEHLARYLFAARLAGRKRVLDIGCGTGYGAAELARSAQSVTAFDISPQAIAMARQACPLPNLQFLAASAEAIPLRESNFQLITCFEVIEHVNEWHRLLHEAHRLLVRSGQFIVSTPNRVYYSETREQTGPNPFHVHEFDFEEFREALTAVFPSVTLYVQNHVAGLSFQPVAERNSQSPDLHLDQSQLEPNQAHFFVAVCANVRQTGAPAFLYIPSTSNVLRERESHVRKLEDEVHLKDNWLKQCQQDLSQLLNAHSALQKELDRAQHWAQAQHEEFEAARRELSATSQAYEERLAANERAARDLISQRDRELEKAIKWAQSEHEQFEASRHELLAMAQAYEDRLAANELAANDLLNKRSEELASAIKWAQSEHEQVEALRRELQATTDRCEALSREWRVTTDRYEALIESIERRRREQADGLGQRLDETVQKLQDALAEVNHLRAILSAVQQSRWLKLGRRVRLGPDLGSV